MLLPDKPDDDAKGFVPWIPWHKCKSKIVCTVKTTKIGSSLMGKNQKHRSSLTRASEQDVQLYRRHDGSKASTISPRPSVLGQVVEPFSGDDTHQRYVLQITSMDEYEFAQVIIEKFVDAKMFDREETINVTEREKDMLEWHHYYQSHIKLVDYFKFFWSPQLQWGEVSDELKNMEDEFEKQVDALIKERVHALAKIHDPIHARDASEVILVRRAERSSQHRRKVEVFITGHGRADTLLHEFHERSSRNWNDRAKQLVKMNAQLSRYDDKLCTASYESFNPKNNTYRQYEKRIGERAFRADAADREDGVSLQDSCRQTQWDRTVKKPEKRLELIEVHMKGIKDELGQIEEDVLTIDNDLNPENGYAIQKRQMRGLQQRKRVLEDRKIVLKKELGQCKDEEAKIAKQVESHRDKFDQQQNVVTVASVDSDATSKLSEFWEQAEEAIEVVYFDADEDAGACIDYDNKESYGEENDDTFEAVTASRSRFKAKVW